MNGVHGITGWQWLFIISGTVTIGQGLLGLLIIPDTPALSRAIWLTDAEKHIAQERMASFGADTSKIIPAAVLKEKLRKLAVHPITYLFLLSFALSAWASRANSYFPLYLEDLKDSSGNLRFTTYQVNIIPIGGYALQIVSNLTLNTLSDWKHWRWQISMAPPFLLGIVLSVLCAWPSDFKVILIFYFLTYATNAGSPSLLAWMAEILRKEPEARAILVALTVTIVYVGHAIRFESGKQRTLQGTLSGSPLQQHSLSRLFSFSLEYCGGRDGISKQLRTSMIHLRVCQLLWLKAIRSQQLTRRLSHKASQRLQTRTSPKYTRVEGFSLICLWLSLPGRDYGVLSLCVE